MHRTLWTLLNMGLTQDFKIEHLQVQNYLEHLQPSRVSGIFKKPPPGETNRQRVENYQLKSQHSHHSYSKLQCQLSKLVSTCISFHLSLTVRTVSTMAKNAIVETSKPHQSLHSYFLSLKKINGCQPEKLICLVPRLYHPRFMLKNIYYKLYFSNSLLTNFYKLFY